MKVSYASMKLKLNTEVNTFDFHGQKIQVLKYLPAKDKYDLLMITLQQAEEDGVYNEFKLNLYFELNLVYMYTNISFTEKQREDEIKIYDSLKSNGFFDLFFEAFNEDEYEELLNELEAIKESKLLSRTTIGFLVDRFIKEIPANMEKAAEIVNSFDPKQYQAVVDFARQANGGRDIITNLPIK